MLDKLHASLDQVLWVVNGYTLALAVLLITAGRLGDLMGKKGLFLTGVAIFTLASLLCGLSTNPGELITFRVIQGLGAALLLPQTLSIIVDIFPHEKRGVALGIWGATAGLSTALGPSVGGLLVDHLDWRWIFFVNVPIGVLTLIAGVYIMTVKKRTVAHRFDMIGTGIATVALFCLAYALIEGQRYNWAGWIWGMLAAAVVLFAIFLLQQRAAQSGEPLVPFELFRSRNFTIINFVGVTMSFGIIGALLPTTIYLQSVLNYSPVKAGLVLLPQALGAMFVAGPAGVMTEKFGGKYILTVGLILYGSGLIWIMADADVNTNWPKLLPAFIMMGVGAGCTFTPAASELMRDVPPRLTGAASGVNNALRQVGSVLAGAILGAILQNQIASGLRSQAATQAAQLPAPYRGAFINGFANAGSSGLQVGAGQTGTSQSLPAGVPHSVATQIQQLGESVFQHGFVHAMGPTMTVGAAVLYAGAISCLFLKGGGPSGNPLGLPLTEDELTSGQPAGAGMAG
jgi:EmrB/QacA subfamily drug resistance transporter